MREAVRKNWLRDASAAQKVVPIAMALALRVLQFKARSWRGTRSLVRILNLHPEDLLRHDHRLAAADVRARGASLVDHTLKRGSACAAEAIAEIGQVDPESAANVLSMATAAAVSTMAKVRRDLRLTPAELRGVIKSEAALVPDVEPAIASEIWRSVLRAKRWSLVTAFNAFILRKLFDLAHLFSKRQWREDPASARRRARAQARIRSATLPSNVTRFPARAAKRDHGRVRVESDRAPGAQLYFPSGRAMTPRYS